MVIAILLGIILFIISLLFYLKTLRIKVQKEQQEKQKARLQKEIFAHKVQLEELRKKKDLLSDQLYVMLKKVQGQKAKISETFQKHIDDKNYEFEQKTQQYKDRMTLGMINYETNIEQEYNRIDERFQKFKKDTQDKIDWYQSKLSALVQNEIRRKKLQDDITFYTIQLSKNEICDILELEKVKKLISKPEVVGKIIWSSYCLPKMGAFETRVLPNKDKVVGIYKITNTENTMVYIGQSRDVATRWRDHIKCGLGATPAAIGNKLYQNMSEFGIWNFTFQLLQECSQKDLNEKEKYWIEQYRSNIVGLNTKGGNK